MSAPETNKRELNKDDSFLGTTKDQKTILTYLFDELESTALESVFGELFKQVEDMYLTNSENVSDKL
ncbi:hypothetical protein KA093_02265 [Candidatus Saccharibacteria bacterium]|nr:hypothetical protein [Candidatus Saccharibacteria bacterium]